MRYVGYVANIGPEVDALVVDYETTDYQQTSETIVAKDRIRLEWGENYDWYTLTLKTDFDKKTGCGTGVLERQYMKWRGGRNQQVFEHGKVYTIFIPDTQRSIFKCDAFWIDVQWQTASANGRMLFEIDKQPDG